MSMALRLCALFAALSLTWLFMKKIIEADEDTVHSFHLANTATQCTIGFPRSIFNWDYQPQISSEKKYIQIDELWDTYRHYGDSRLRLLRTLLAMLVFIPFCWLLIINTGGLPDPTRGDISHTLDWAIEVMAFCAASFLTWLVADGMRLCARFISHLQQGLSIWPKKTSKEAQYLWGLDEELVANWLDIQFVAKRTVVMSKFVWYPFLPVLLLCLARYPFIDNWTTTAGSITILVILIGYLIACAFLLQHGAKAMRNKALHFSRIDLQKLRNLSDHHTDKLSLTDNPEGSLQTRQRLELMEAIRKEHAVALERMINEIEDTREGAFTPFMQQPLVQALLTTLSGSGGLFLLLQQLG